MFFFNYALRHILAISQNAREIGCLLLGPHSLFGGGGGGVGFGSDTEDTVKLIRIEKQNKSKIQKWQYFFLKRIKS